jgi:hypothetical protein
MDPVAAACSTEREIQRSPRKPLAEVARELADPGARD